MAANMPKFTPVEKPNDLPDTTTYITGHDEATGKAIVRSTRPAAWESPVGKKIAFNSIYTTSEFPAVLTKDADLAAHDALLASGTLGLVQPGGTVCRIVDFPPSSVPVMHRTLSVDYGIVLEGVIEMELDSGSVVTMRRGDIAVQRATMHAWRNPSATDWCRMVFVLQECQAPVVSGKPLTEDLSRAGEIGPPSESEG